MGRARLLKPTFFTNELLAELPFEGRLLFAGLWTLADREGRLEDRPKRIKAELFPWDVVDVSLLLDALAQRGFVCRYEAAGNRLIQIAKFSDHQTPHQREQQSVLPALDSGEREASPVKAVTSPSVYGNGSSSVTGNGSVSGVLTFATAGTPCTWGLSQGQIDDWCTLFPGISVLGECRKALAWIQANPGRRKTAKGMPRFLVSWLGRATDNQKAVHQAAPANRWQPSTVGRYVVPCPHERSCENRRACCERQDRERRGVA